MYWLHVDRILTRVSGSHVKLGGVVINRRMLNTTAGKLITAISAIIGAIVTLEEDTTDYMHYNRTACDLTTSEITTVQGMMQQRDPSCLYNMTIDTVLAMDAQ